MKFQDLMVFCDLECSDVFRILETGARVERRRCEVRGAEGVSAGGGFPRKCFNILN